MADNETKKALECCIKEDCANCPIYTPDEKCIHTLHKSSLDLINRKQEMIDGLIAGQETLQKALAEKQAEIERLTLEYAGFEAATKQFIKDSKTIEALKR